MTFYTDRTGPRCQVELQILRAACFQSDRPGLGIMLTKQLQLPVIPCSFRKHKQRNLIKKSQNKG